MERRDRLLAKADELERWGLAHAESNALAALDALSRAAWLRELAGRIR